jgi:alkylation response protein AidB-like acyl-CoA dehydrogenase
MWDELVEAGVFSLLADGFGWADAAVVFEELGRAAVPGPLVWGVLAHDADRPPRVVGGLERPPRGAPVLVEHLHALDALVVLDPDGIHELDPAALAAEPVEWPLDPLSPVSRVADLTSGERVAGAGDAARWRLQGAVLTAAFAVGLAAAACDLAVAYAKERQQFGRAIGAFQAVKHLCAEMAVRAEVARAATHAAAVHLDDPGLGGTERAVSGAKALAGGAAIANGRSATQVHGGMGFTWEVDVHLYLKRAWLLDTVFGSTDEHADRVAATLVLGAPGAE